MLTVADYVAMVGDVQTARRCLDQLAAKGRIADLLGVEHLTFPTWTPVPG
jgi:hypothetical protein